MKKLNENIFFKKIKVIKEESDFSNILAGNEQQRVPPKLSLADKYMVAYHTRKAISSSGILKKLAYYIPGGGVKEASNFINYLQTKDPQSYIDYVIQLKKNQQNPEGLKPIYNAVLQYYEKIKSTQSQNKNQLTKNQPVNNQPVNNQPVNNQPVNIQQNSEKNIQKSKYAYSGKGRPKKTDIVSGNMKTFPSRTAPTSLKQNYELDLNGLKYIIEEVIKNG